jgi:hypothetical protein
MVFALNYSHAEGSPATQLKITYLNHAIEIEANHPSQRLDRHYIKKVVVTRNLKEKQYFYFPRQSSSNKFIANLAYKAAPGDYLELEFFCSQGGVALGKLNIPQDIKEKEAK